MTNDHYGPCGLCGELVRDGEVHGSGACDHGNSLGRKRFELAKAFALECLRTPIDVNLGLSIPSIPNVIARRSVACADALLDELAKERK